MPTKKSEKKNNLTFEQAMQRLEEISTLLEKGDAMLEESLSLYEEGVTLIRHCEEVLNNAKTKIVNLTSHTDE